MIKQHLTLLRMPSWLGYTEERVLPQPPEAYQVVQLKPDWWCVQIQASGEAVYTGIGPVEVIQSSAPF